VRVERRNEQYGEPAAQLPRGALRPDPNADDRPVTYKDLDLLLLRELQRDARRSNRQLAEALGVAASTVGARLKDLEDRGVLRGYRAVIDYGKLGLGLVAVTRIKARGEALPAIVRSLAQHPSLTHVYEITGDFDVMVIGRFANETEMNREIKRMLSLPGIEGTNTSVVLDAPKESLDVRLAPGERGSAGGDGDG
jgi:DNA-binding Lrp family transcriptional regulator